jgi:hypothetical protein
MMADAEQRLSTVVITLLKGVLWREDDHMLWTWLGQQQGRVRDHLNVLALDLMLDENEGYAYLRQRVSNEDADELPRLVPRRQLPFPVSLLLALLRRRLAEFDAHGADTRLVMSRDELVDLMRDFYPDAGNDVRLISKISRTIEKVGQLGFLRKLKTGSDKYEVSRIIKAFIDADWLAQLDEKLEAYRAHAIAAEEEEDA